MSILAPVQLLDYAVEQLEYSLQLPSARPLPEPAAAAGLTFNMRMNEDASSGVYRLQLQVSFNQDEPPPEVEGHIYHKGSITITGWVKWATDESKSKADDPRKLLLVSGMSMLYGIARERIAQATASGPAARMILPSVSFLPLVEDWLTRNQQGN